MGLSRSEALREYGSAVRKLEQGKAEAARRAASGDRVGARQTSRDAHDAARREIEALRKGQRRG